MTKRRESHYEAVDVPHAVHAERLERRQLFAALTSAADPVSLADADGTAITFALAGPGAADVTAVDGRLQVSLQGTTARSSLTITTGPGGDGQAALGDVDIATGLLRNLTVEGSATGMVLRVVRVSKINISGDFSDAKILCLPRYDYRGPTGIGALSVGGAIRSTRVNALADIGSVTASAMYDSSVMAGVRYAADLRGVFEQPLPAEQHGIQDFDFLGSYRINRVRVAEREPVGGEFKFVNSRVRAYRMGEVKLGGIQPENGRRPLGVAAYQVKRVQRRFGGPSGAEQTANAAPGIHEFVARQIKQPLAFDRDGASGGGTGVLIKFPWLPSDENIPEGGIKVGAVYGHVPATTAWLNPDGTYDARDTAGNVVTARNSLVELATELVATPGTSVKVVARPNTSGRAETLRFLSTSVSPQLVITAYYDAAYTYFGDGGARFKFPTVGELSPQFAALGYDVAVAHDDFSMIVDTEEVIGRRFDEETGVHTLTLTPELTYHLDGQPVEQSQLTTALLGSSTWSGDSRRMPTRLVAETFYGITLSGLGDGGTAAFYAVGRDYLNATGGIHHTPSAAELTSQLEAALPAGMSMVTHSFV